MIVVVEGTSYQSAIGAAKKAFTKSNEEYSDVAYFDMFTLFTGDWCAYQRSWDNDMLPYDLYDMLKPFWASNERAKRNIPYQGRKWCKAYYEKHIIPTLKDVRKNAFKYYKLLDEQKEWLTPQARVWALNMIFFEILRAVDVLNVVLKEYKSGFLKDRLLIISNWWPFAASFNTDNNRKYVVGNEQGIGTSGLSFMCRYHSYTPKTASPDENDKRLKDSSWFLPDAIFTGDKDFKYHLEDVYRITEDDCSFYTFIKFVFGHLIIPDYYVYTTGKVFKKNDYPLRFYRDVREQFIDNLRLLDLAKVDANVGIVISRTGTCRFAEKLADHTILVNYENIQDDIHFMDSDIAPDGFVATREDYKRNSTANEKLKVIIHDKLKELQQQENKPLVTEIVIEK